MPSILVVVILLSLCGCVPLHGAQRAADASSACVRAALRSNTLAGLPDKQAHCRATALIAAHCSVSEAYLASLAKEWLDLFGPGNAEWADLRADRAGVRCARTARTDDEAAQCCEPTVQRNGR